MRWFGVAEFAGVLYVVGEGASSDELTASQARSLSEMTAEHPAALAAWWLGDDALREAHDADLLRREEEESRKSIAEQVAAFQELAHRARLTCAEDVVAAFRRDLENEAWKALLEAEGAL